MRGIGARSEMWRCDFAIASHRPAGVSWVRRAPSCVRSRGDRGQTDDPELSPFFPALAFRQQLPWCSRLLYFALEL
jgi:hypothetical protein